MRKAVIILALTLVLASPLMSAQGKNDLETGAGSPIGACSNSIYADTTNGASWVCKGSVWQQVGGGSGSGTVTTTGTPASGNLAVFSGATSVTNANISGDCTTAGTAAITCTKTNGLTFAASATTDTTNAANISSGTLGAARLPNPSATTLGGIESLAPVTSKWINAISATGVPSATQPAFTDISGTASASQIPAALPNTTSVNGTSIPASATVTVTIASGTATLGTAAISSNTCAAVVTVTATGVTTTDNIEADFNADPTGNIGYQPGAMLTIIKYPTAGAVNFRVCNSTASSITPAAETLNWRVVR